MLSKSSSSNNLLAIGSTFPFGIPLLVPFTGFALTPGSFSTVISKRFKNLSFPFTSLKVNLLVLVAALGSLKDQSDVVIILVGIFNLEAAFTIASDTPV